jgi:very-short-patch-repair endonuclease
MELDEELRGLASAQYGVVSRAQMSSIGFTQKAIEHRLKKSAIEVVRPAVYRLVGAPITWEQKLMAMCLWAGQGSAASHRSAAALWRLPGFDPGPTELTTKRAIKADDVTVYRTIALEEAEITDIAGIPTTSIGRTLVDLAAVSPVRLIEDAVDDIMRRRLLTLSEIRDLLRRCAKERRQGTRLLRRVLQSTDVRVIGTQSVFESRLLRLLLKAELPRPIPQFRIKEKSRLVARVDFAYPDAKVIIEAESHRWHSGPRAIDKDNDRYDELRALGWIVIRVTWHQLMNEPHKVIERVRDALLPQLMQI